MKRCYKCAQTKTEGEFSKDKTRFDGLQPRCKSCYSAYHGARYKRKPPRVFVTEEHKRDRARRWRVKNRARLNAQGTAWLEANKEEFAAYAKKWRADNAERTKPIRARWKVDNADKVREQNREHRLNNKDYYRFHARLRQATKMRATPAWADLNAIAAVYAEALRLSEETGILHHVDHIVPLRGKTVCGLHWEGNLQILSATENLSKGNRHWPDMGMAA